jgi:U3 small nucleolar RNA-associated protein 20
VYRTFDRGSSSNGIQGAGLTSAATRESHVHNPRQDDRAKKRQRKHHKTIDSNITSGKTRRDDVQEDVGGNDLQGLGGVRTLVEDLPLEKEIISSMTTFASELDVAVDRNASEIFSGYHRKVWRLVRSLPEILHNVEEIIDIHLAYMLSPSSDPETVSSRLLLQRETTDERLGFVVNHATTDILHLLAVLARDLRHEIHPYLHTKIIPRIVYDLLNPPPPPPESERQPIPVDVTIVEAAFRSLSYIFRYDLQNVVDEMELMRKYYGVTLGNRRELVRRLSAETFAPLIRKLKGRKEVERHIRRVLTALSSTGVPDTSNRQLIRSQADAVDGISQLFFLLVRGPVRGTFYSQGDSTFEFILACICGEGLRGKESRLKDPDVDERNEKDPNNYDLVFEVGYSILSSLCRHFDASTISAVSQILFETVKKSVASYSDALETCTATMSKTVVVPIISGIKLVVRLLSFQSGSLLQHLYANQLKPFDEYVQRLCSETFIGSLREKSDHGDVVSLICQVLAYSQTTGTMSIHAVDFVRNMLKVKDLPTQQLYSRSLVLTKELLPQMQVKSERISAIVLLLDAAARVIQNSKRDGIEILFAVVSNTQSHEKCFQGVDFPIFGVNGQERLDLSQTTSKTLMGAVLEDVVDEFKAADEAGLAFLAVKVRCVPFLLLMNKNGSDELKLHKRIISWLSKLLELPKLFCSSLSQDQVIAQALVVEATATVLVMISDELDAATVLTAAKKTTNAASKLLLDHCSSPWTVRAAASLIPVLEKFSLNLTDYPNKVFECVIPNLESPNHFLRLYTLKILCTFPKIPFVVDHAELDLQGDLDEEPSNPAIAGSSTSNSPGPVGPCDILDTLLLLESSPVSLHGERQLLGLISKVEILARTGRLPVVYVEAAACHMLGIMNLKFAPVWPAAKSAVATLVTTHEKIVWPFLEAKLKEVMTSPSEVSETAVENKDFCFQQRQKSEDHDHTNTETFFDVHLNMCRSWESSNGTNVELAGTSLLTEEDVVPCFHVTDPETVMEFVWKVAEMKQNVFAHHSRVLVPVFLGFLHNQYFDQHSDDQDALELCLDLHVEQEQ